MSKQKQTFFQKAQGMIDITDEDVFIGANENEDENNDEPFDDDEDNDIDPEFPPLKCYTDLKVFDNPKIFQQSLSLTQQNRIILDIITSVIELDRAAIKKEQERALRFKGDTETEVNSPPALFMMDGDTSQVEAVMQYMDRTPKGLDEFKHCGGCSGVYQSNDTGKIHSTLKETSKTASSKNIEKPPFLDHIVDVMRTKGMKGKSLQVYSSFLTNMFFLYSRSMTQPIISHAWESAGIVNQKPDKLKILNAISSYATLSQINANRIDAAMEELQEDVDTNLKVDEGHMQRLLKDIMNTDIDPNKAKTIGQERAMVLTCSAQILERKRKIDLKKQEAVAKQAADEAKATKKAEKAAAILKDAIELALLPGPPSSSTSCQSPSCCSGITVPVSFADSAKANLWKGCPSCRSTSWFCGLVACQKMLRNHRSICNQKQLVLGAPAVLEH